MGFGFAGIDNPMFDYKNTYLFLGNAKKNCADLV